LNELTHLVRNARIARREHRSWPTAEALKAYLEALSAKMAAIKKAIAAHFKQAMADAGRRRKGMWPLAKCARDRSLLLPTTRSISNLVTSSLLASTSPKIAEALKCQFFPLYPMLTLLIFLKPFSQLHCLPHC
jgi:hypothetical protein